MDSAALLDILGNENRRRILRLLARKPCYVTEISEYLGVSPKAVIDHLRKLEEAGIVESHIDDQRRKYFHIARNLRLEVNLSPHGFGAKSAYPASRSLDITTCSHVSVNVQVEEVEDEPERLAAKLRRLEELENELSMAQRWVQGHIAETFDRLIESVDGDPETDGYLRAEVLVALADGHSRVEEIAAEVDVPPGVVEEALFALAELGVVDRDEQGWHLAD